jgi:hypothetical protein
MKKTTKPVKKAPVEYYIRINQEGDSNPEGYALDGVYLTTGEAAEEGNDGDVIYKITPIGKVVFPDPDPQYVPFK